MCASARSGHHTFAVAGGVASPPRTTTPPLDLATTVAEPATNNRSGRYGRRRRRWGREGRTVCREIARGRRAHHRRGSSSRENCTSPPMKQFEGGRRHRGCQIRLLGSASTGGAAQGERALRHHQGGAWGRRERTGSRRERSSGK